jgi:hypothetical protein
MLDKKCYKCYFKYKSKYVFHLCSYLKTLFKGIAIECIC